MIARSQNRLANATRSSHARSRKSFNHSPMLVFYKLTRACDLVCQHCQACAQELRDPNELDTAGSKRLIDQLSDFPDPPMLFLTGGDPLKRTDIYELIEYTLGTGIDVSLTPSATPLLDGDSIRRLREAGISCIAISVDGADAATHDANRGVPGSFDHSMHVLHIACAFGVETQINTTLTPANVDQIESIAELFRTLDIALSSVFFLVPVGRAAAMDRLNADESRKYKQIVSRPSPSLGTQRIPSKQTIRYCSLFHFTRSLQELSHAHP